MVCAFSADVGVTGQEGECYDECNRLTAAVQYVAINGYNRYATY